MIRATTDWIMDIPSHAQPGEDPFWEDDVGRAVEYRHGLGWYVYGTRISNQPETQADLLVLMVAMGVNRGEF